ncbi:hypothetical protein [Actinoplanes regularis]|uniref:hypothetical protein n=1 Tax=Actinoplanes regularis TaxID=52697 RepID=UPI002555C522|nr:hypothetical protein [Actinoplanes regularis]
MVAEAALLEQLSPTARLKLVLEVIDDTIASLPEGVEQLLVGEAGATVEAAIRSIRAAVSGSEPEELADEVGDELLELADDFDLMPLWQLFMGIFYCVGVEASETSSDLARETLAALYDGVRDSEDLPEFPVGTAEDVVLAVEMANERCLRAIVRQKELIREAAGVS